MPKQLNVDLRFSADTSQAKKQIQDLQASLSKLGVDASKSMSFDNMNSELKEATNNISMLKAQLQSAFNTNTGKLDLTKFSQEMQKSGMTLEKYRKSLVALGPEGSKAFANLANSIAAADVPLMKTNKLLTEMGTVLKNTIKWQISSSAIHGFMGAIQQAYGYAQNLNESLTNIQIVTQHNSDQMAGFAAQANRAAQALSTTTTAYTDAALIFYQQGLDDQAVKERTDATIKMAQVTGDAATEVSSYMTAIWNNFDNGTESLEHYADVITALGAATASSSSEIAEGLSKFASIADTVGLSYEYATSALATVVAQTRQSADVVGTAFKTIFARIQDLEQGATLEDGVDLGQYAKALAKVGVDVLDMNGQLREMDDILDDIGQRWGELGEAERVALAQNVAGQRQYAQFMAIFENWDTFKTNLGTANASEGMLQEQADIYAKSWEASQKRVRAAMEGIYQSIINDDFFISLNDGLAKGLDGVNKLIKALGGMPGVLSTITVLATKLFSGQIAEGLRNTTLNIMSMTAGGRQKIKDMQTEALTKAQGSFEEGGAESTAYKAKLAVQQTYLENAEQINELEKASIDFQKNHLDVLAQEAIEIEKQNKLYEEQIVLLGNKMDKMVTDNGGNYTKYINAKRKYATEAGKFGAASGDLDYDTAQHVASITQELREVKINDGSLKSFKEELKSIISTLELTTEQSQKFKDALKLQNNGLETWHKLSDAFKEIGINLYDLETHSEGMRKAGAAMAKEMSNTKDGTKEASKAITEFGQTIINSNNGAEKLETHLEVLDEEAERIQGNISKAARAQTDFAQSIVYCAQAISTMTMAYNSFKGLYETWQDTDTSFEDKMVTTLTTLGMVIPMVASSIKSLADAKILDTLANEKDIISTLLWITTNGKVGKVAESTAAKMLLLNLAKKAGVEVTEEMTISQIIATAGTEALGKAALTTAGEIAAAVAPILAVVAAIAAVVAISKLMYDAYNADANAAKKAQENAQELAKAYNEATNAYNELKTSISNYKSAIKGLEELTRGTQDFRDALKEANDYAFELIETANLTPDQYSWENGVLTISDDVLEQAQQIAYAQMNTLQAASVSAQTQALNASNSATNTGLARQIYSDNFANNSTLNTIQDLGYRSGNIFGIGMANNALAISEWGPEITESLLNLGGEIDGFFANLMNRQDWAEQLRGIGTDVVYGETQRELEQLAEAYQEQGRTALLDSDLFNSATEEMQNSIEEYCESMAEATQATRLHNQEIAHAILDSEDYSDEIINFASNAYDEAYQNIYDEVIEASHNFEQSNTESTEGAAEFFARYAEAAGLEAGTRLERIEGSDDNRKYTYYENGELQTVTEEYIASVIASAESVSTLGEAAAEAANYLAGFSNQSQQDFLNDLFGSVYNGQIHYEEFLGDYLTTNNAQMTPAELMNSIGLTEEDLTEAYRIAGVPLFKTFDGYANQIEQASANVFEAFNNFIAESSGEVQGFYETQLENQPVRLDTAKSILNTLDSAIANGAGKQFEEIASNVAPEALDEFASTMSNIDWNSINPREFLASLRESGFEIDGFEGVLVDFCNSMRTVTAETVAASAEYFNALQEIANGLSDQSDEISAEDFASLPEDMQQFFALTIDGTYKLLGAARDFQDYIENQRIAEAIENRNALYSQYDEATRGMSAGDIEKGAADEQYSQYLAQDMAIALHYDDLQELQRAYAEGTVATVEAFNTAAYQIDQAQDTAMLDQEEWQNYADYIQEAGAAMEGFNDEMSDMEADIVAKSIMKMNQAIDTLGSNFEEWRDILENSTEASEEYAEALIGTRRAVAELLDISEDYVSSDFITEHLEEISQAAEGNAEAIDQLRVELADSVSSMIASALASSEADANKIENVLDDLINRAQQFDDMEVGASLYLNGKDGFVEALNEMIAATGMTVDQVNALCDSMGFEANFASEGQRIPTTIPEYTTHHEIINQKPQKFGDGQEATTWDEITWTEQTGEHKAEGVAMAYAFTTDGTTPQINSVTRKPSGSANNSSSSNRGGSSSGGGGGGGSKGSEKKKKDPTSESERYHVINNQLEDNTKLLEQMSKAKDRAYGKAKLNYMDAEIERQKESIALNEEKLRQVEEFYKLDQEAIAGYGAQFDANGTIINYDQMLQDQIDKYNAAVDAYNNGAMDNAAEEVFQQAEDDYNAFTEALKQYEETQDLWYEQYQAVADAKAELLSLQIQKIDYKVQLGIEWEDDDIERLDFLLNRIQDDAFKAAQSIGLLGEKAVDAMDKYNTYQQGLTDTLSALGVSNAGDVLQRAMNGESLVDMAASQIDASTAGEAVEQMGNYISEMMKELEAAETAIKEAFEQVKNVFDTNNEKMDKYIDKIKHAQNVTKSYQNIVDIVGKKSLSITNEMMRGFNQMSVEQAIAAENAARVKMDTIQSELEEAQARLAQATTEKEQQYWQGLIDEQEEALITATENFHQAWEDALQANLEAFENNVDLMIEDFSDAVGDLKAMQAEFDLQEQVNELYEPDYERWHQLSELINDIDDSVNNKENLRYKQDLLDLEQEIIGLQEEGKELSEYDLEYLRLRYESKLAEMALEEAQNAKSQVRMSRDNEGNYSYVYTADDNAVKSAEDDYKNKIYEMEKANAQYVKKLQQQLMEVSDKMRDQIKKAAEIYGIGTDEYKAAVDRIHQAYLAESQFIEEQLDNVFVNNQRLRDEDIVQYINYTGDIAAANVQLATDFGDTFVGIQTGCDDLHTYFDGTWYPALEATYENIKTEVESYGETNEVVMQTAGTTMDGFKNTAQADLGEVTRRTQELSRATEEYGREAVENFAAAASAWQNGPAKLISSIEAQASAIAALAQQYIALKQAIDAAAASATAAQAAGASTDSTGSSNSSGGSSSGGSGGGSTSSSSGGGGNKDTLTKDTLTNTSSGDKGDFIHRTVIINQNTSTTGSLRDELKKKRKATFATGGYTGDWGDDGRLAILHEKELVLNASDTKNFLTAIDIVRQLTDVIDLNTLTANGINSSKRFGSPSTSGTLEQQVTISASFPAVTDRHEIEEALGNLVNVAAQFANRKDE